MSAIGPVRAVNWEVVDDEFEQGTEVDIKPERPSSDVEFTSSVEPHIIYSQYFAIPDSRFALSGVIPSFEFMFLQIDGIRIKLVGLSEEESCREMEEPFRGIFERILDKSELKQVLDQYLSENLHTHFGENNPYLSLVSNQSELIRVLNDLNGSAREKASLILPILEKTEHLFSSTLVGFSKPLKTSQIQFLLGETLFNQTLSRMPFKWQLPKENVHDFHELIFTAKCNIFPFKSDPLISLSGEYLEGIDHPIEYDYLVEIAQLIGLQIPRLESLKIALKKYFQTQRMLAYATHDMIDQVKQFKRIGPGPEKTAFFDELMGEYTEDQRFAFSQILGLVLLDEDEDLMTPLICVTLGDADYEPQIEMDEDGFDLTELDQAATFELEQACLDLGFRVDFTIRGKHVVIGGRRESGINDRFVQVSSSEEP